jgi:hypothetical protein
MSLISGCEIPLKPINSNFLIPVSVDQIPTQRKDVSMTIPTILTRIISLPRNSDIKGLSHWYKRKRIHHIPQRSHILENNIFLIWFFLQRFFDTSLVRKSPSPDVRTARILNSHTRLPNSPNSSSVIYWSMIGW